MEETPKKSSFKENWLKEDEKCITCGQVTKQQKGLTKQNLRKLFVPKRDMNELIITLLLLALILLGLMYKAETKTCREWLDNMNDKSKCYTACDSINKDKEVNPLNELTNLNLNNLSLNP